MDYRICECKDKRVVRRIRSKFVECVGNATAWAQVAIVVTATLAITSAQGSRPSNSPVRSYGLSARPISKPYLRMPQSASGEFPSRLSQTGVFTDVRAATPAAGLIPYDVIVPFWSDGASKSRWMALPNERIQFAASGEWKFPDGTVFVKEFDLSIDDTSLTVKRRLETRLLVRDHNGGVYGVTYKSVSYTHLDVYKRQAH